jgi:dTDP-4-dehydrorhamnose reductase
MMRILLFGKNGQLGWELQRCLPTLGSVLAVDQEDLDLIDTQQLRTFIQEQEPELIVNAAAYTAVDRAEDQPDMASSINEVAPRVMAEQARALNSLMVHYSTDYVFDGDSEIPYKETDQPNPINVYGQTKYEGERAIQAVDPLFLIFRTSWVYSLRGTGFMQTMLRLAESQENLRVVTDQVGSPTWARMLAEASTQVLVKATSDIQSFGLEHKGIYHLAGKGAASRYEWAKSIIEFAQQSDPKYNARLLPGLSDDFPTKAARPANSALDIRLFTKTFGIHFPPWQESLSLALMSL